MNEGKRKIGTLDRIETKQPGFLTANTHSGLATKIVSCKTQRSATSDVADSWVDQSDDGFLHCTKKKVSTQRE